MRLPGARRNRHLPTTQTPSAHQHPVPIPVLPQLTCLQIFTREKGTKKVQGEGGKGAKLCIVKRFVPQAPCLPPPLKAIGCNLKSTAGRIRQRRWGRRKNPSASSSGNLWAMARMTWQERGAVPASGSPLYWGGAAGR